MAFIVVIMTQNTHLIIAKAVDQFVGKCCLAASGASCNSNQNCIHPTAPDYYFPMIASVALVPRRLAPASIIAWASSAV